MREIIEFLLKIEKMAADIYKDASVFFKHDEEFARFLSLLAEDEVSHYYAMVSAREYFVGAAGAAPGFIVLNRATRERIEGPLKDIREKVSAGHLTKEAMIGCMVTAEFSEWNDIFLYVVNTLRDSSPQYQHVAAKIQQHKQQIETFLEPLPDGRKHLERVRQLPDVWRQRILIVEDDPAVAELLSAILAEEGMVETAEDGERGLRKTGEQYFDVIVSDMVMPVMGGVEFYTQAAEEDRSIGERFLFFTGQPTAENLDFFAKYNLRYMIKPTDIAEIRLAVRDLMHKDSSND